MAEQGREVDVKEELGKEEDGEGREKLRAGDRLSKLKGKYR